MIAALDLGTTSIRFIVYSVKGEVLFSSQKEFTQIMPQKDYVEHDPEEIWNVTVEVITDVMTKNKIEIDCLGITNQRETTIAFDCKTGKPLYNAIVWMDTRSEILCQAKKKQIGKKGEEAVRDKTGLPIVPYFSATKMKWLVSNVETVKKAAENDTLRFCTIDSWILYKLSAGKVFATDVTNASRTLLMDLTTLEYDVEMLKLWDINTQWLPKIRPSACLFHVINNHEELNFLSGVKITGILGDQQSALFGQTCFHKGDIKNTYGTGCFLLMNTGTKPFMSKHGLLTTVAFQKDGEDATYALEGSVAIGGAVIQWLRDNLEIIKSASESEGLAKSVSNNGGVYFVPAFSGLYAPYWRTDARGVIVGLTRFATKAHLARAAIEATAFQVNDVVQAMHKDVDSSFKISKFKVDGGMVANKLLLQLQSDISQVQIVVPTILETTALGAAFCAALGNGIYKNLDDISRTWKQKSTYTPKIDISQRDEMLKNWNKAIERTFNWSN